MSALTLTRAEQMKLVDCEQNIERGMETFVSVGASLAMIREQKLFRDTHGTFEEYCQDRWGWTSRRARQLIGASEVVSALESGTTVPPTNEAQARELVPVPEEKRAEVWETATKAAKSEGKKPTASHVRTAAKPYKPATTPRPKAPSKVDALREQRERQAEHATARARNTDSDIEAQRLAHLQAAESSLAQAASFRLHGQTKIELELIRVRDLIRVLRQEVA